MAEINYGERPLEDFIVQAFDVLTQQQVQEILDLAEHSNLWARPGEGANPTDPGLRNCDTLDVSANREQEDMRRINDIMFGAMSNAVSFYRAVHPLLEIQMDTGYELLRYHAGSRCGNHVDSYRMRPRTLTCSIALNDDYKGGEFSILDGRFKTKPRAGTALMFPSNFMYPHEVLPILSGTRYSMITWLI